MKTLHRQSFILIEQTEAHIIIGLFLYRGKGQAEWQGRNMKTQTFSSSFFSSSASAAAAEAPPPAAGAAAAPPPPDGTCTHDVSKVTRDYPKSRTEANLPEPSAMSYRMMR
jgi:hypothetical protein